MPRSSIAGSSGSDVPSFLRNRQTDFQRGCTNLQPHQQWRSVHLYPHPLQHLLSLEFLILAILTDVRWNLRVVLICISLMTNEVERFFKMLLSHPKFFRWEFFLLYFSFDQQEVSLSLLWWLWVESQFYLILKWLLQLVSWDHLLVKLSSSLLL